MGGHTSASMALHWYMHACSCSSGRLPRSSVMTFRFFPGAIAEKTHLDFVKLRLFFLFSPGVELSRLLLRFVNSGGSHRSSSCHAEPLGNLPSCFMFPFAVVDRLAIRRLPYGCDCLLFFRVPSPGPQGPTCTMCAGSPSTAYLFVVVRSSSDPALRARRNAVKLEFTTIDKPPAPPKI